MEELELRVVNRTGLHARPAALFVRTAGGYRSAIHVENVTRGQAPVDAKRMLAVLGLGVEQGHTVRIRAEGDDEAAAIVGLRELIASGFGEPIDEGPARIPGPPRGAAAPDGPVVAPGGPHVLPGVLAAPGIAMGPAWVAGATSPADGTAVSQPALSIRDGAARAAGDLRALALRLADHGAASDELAILEAQAEMALDEQLLSDAEHRAVAGLHPALAVEAAAAPVAARLAAFEDEVLAARAADVRDVAARIARWIRGETVALPDTPSVAVADDLPPSVIAEIQPGWLLAIALVSGSPTAHAAILARALGIPAVVGVAGLLDAIRAAAGEGSVVAVAVDGERGEVIVAPDEERRRELRDRAAVAARRAEEDRAASRAAIPGAHGILRIGRGRDVREVRLVANIGRPEEAARAIEAGAGGVGLFRTEFLFMGRSGPPGEEEQAQAYGQVLRAFGQDRPVVIRLVDIGGDKAIPYLGLTAEANPFLGVRAIRLAYGTPGLLLAQLRAIMRAATAAGVTPHIMVPMVATVEDLDLFFSLRDQALGTVVAEGLTVPGRIVSGVMIEVPSAVLLATELAQRVDFFSIGTNDLSQYLLAADRTNPALDRLHDALHPAVLRAIRSTVDAAAAARIPVSVCGELAGDPDGALVLTGLGVDELSMDAGSLGRVARALRDAYPESLRGLAQRARAAASAPEVRDLVRALDAGTSV